MPGHGSGPRPPKPGVGPDVDGVRLPARAAVAQEVVRQWTSRIPEPRLGLALIDEPVCVGRAHNGRKTAG